MFGRYHCEVVPWRQLLTWDLPCLNCETAYCFCFCVSTRVKGSFCAWGLFCSTSQYDHSCCPWNSENWHFKVCVARSWNKSRCMFAIISWNTQEVLFSARPSMNTVTVLEIVKNGRFKDFVVHSSKSIWNVITNFSRFSPWWVIMNFRCNWRFVCSAS